MLAGRFSRLDAGTVAGAAATGTGPLVLWASQTGNAEEFAGKLGDRLEDARLQAMDDVELSDLADAEKVLIVTSTFGDGGPPDNGADFWERLESPDAPSLAGLRYSVLGIGDRSYDNFCGHAKSLDTRLADLGATRLLDRAECEAYDDQPMAQWADAVLGLMASADAPPPLPRETPAPATPAPFTRAHPIAAPLCRNIRLTPADATKEVRQFGFDISDHDVTYSAGDSLGVYVRNSGQSSRLGSRQPDSAVTSRSSSTVPISRCGRR